MPFTIGYRPLWTSLGIIGGYLAAILGLSFYVRRRIGARLWRRLHRLTVVVYVLALVHALGAGTDASLPTGPLRAARERRPRARAVRGADRQGARNARAQARRTHRRSPRAEWLGGRLKGEPMSFIPSIDESACISQGDCAELAPDVFEVDRLARVIGTGPDATLLEAARNCPTEAIVLRDSETGEQVYP